ncbi:TolB family protein [Saccharicrinis sp. FJH2]|uniref:TolB family protein n=1 Tax=Saccharicrinis sp. FJH65 TaxID=3344659 RepID=UPI0035F2528C
MKRFLYLTLLVMLFGSCSTIQYSVQSVPEEGSTQFVKYTEDEDHVVGPHIMKYGYLFWYAPSCIAVSNDGAKLAYIAKNNDFMNLYIRSVEGGRSVVQRTFNKNIYDMSFSPNDSNIVFTGTNEKNLYLPSTNSTVVSTIMNIHRINTVGGSAVQQLVSTSQQELGGVYSPDGKKVYFSREQGSQYYIWSIDLKSSLMTQYCEGFTPQVTRDGKNLVITRNSKDGKYRGEIWMVNIENGTETLILSDPEMGFSTPQLSSDGKTIVCVGSTAKQSNKPMNLDIYVANIDGTNLRQLTFHPGHDVSPQWSPDGKSIFFISQRGGKNGQFNVWKMNYNK